MSPQEERADLPYLPPVRVHLFLREFYRYFSCHNNRLHLDGEVPDDTLCKSRWRNLTAQSSRWYTTLLGTVGRRFTEILVE